MQAIENAGTAEVQEITQAGTAQKTAVEGAGTQAVESVENVKASATEAVETAKTEAVQSVQTEGNTQTGNVTTEGTKQVKAVQDKGNEVLQSIPEDFQMQMESKLDKQQGVENKGKALVIGEDGNVAPGEVQSGGGDGIAIINTMSGESPLMIPDSAERVNKGLELGGKTEQVQTSGKNLFDFSNLESGRINISTGALEEHNHTRRLADYIDITDITSYSIYLPGYNKANGAVYVIIYYYDKDKNYLSYKPCGDKIEKYENITPVENAVYIKVTLEQNTIDNPQNIFKVQLEKGAKSTDYEPYTGGKPAPSPEYPQEIKSVGKWNGEKQKYEVDVKITGKNLFDIEKASEKANWTQHNNFPGYYNFPVFVGKDNTVTISIPQKIPTGQGLFLSVCLSESGGREGWIAHNSNASLNNAKLTYKATTDYIYLNAHSDTIAGMERFFGELQIECGNVATPYQPYTEQSLTLTSDRPLTKWDKLVEQDGQIGWLYKSREVNFTGEESWKRHTETDMSVWFVCYNCLHGIKTHNVAQNIGVFNNYALWSKEIVDDRVGKFCTNGNLSNNFFLAGMPKDYTVETFKAWLREKNEYGKPMRLTYETETTEFIPLPQSEQNAIRALKTYYPTTVITTDGGELDPDIKVTYTADTKNYIDGKVSANVASIISQYQLNTANLLSLMPMETQATMIENDTNNILNNLESEETHE